MSSKPARICFSLLIGLCLLAPVAQEKSFAGHPPYVDPHFDLHHTPKYDYGTRSTYSDYGSHSTSGTHVASTCNTCNANPGNSEASNGLSSRSPNCPPVQNAILKLWVPDGCQVEVNGQPTKPQTLGGIHKNSRIFSLDGLQSDRVSPCEMTVIICNEFGEAISSSRSISVQAGQHYEVRYPDGFTFIEIESAFVVPENAPIILEPQYFDTDEMIPMHGAPVVVPNSEFNVH